MTKTNQLQKIVAEMANESGRDTTVTISYNYSDLSEARVYDKEYLPDVKIEEK